MLKFIIKKYYSDTLTDLEKQVLYNIDPNILYVKRDIDIMHSNKDDIFGYKIVKGEDVVRYIRYDRVKNTFVKATNEEMKLIIKNINRAIKKEKPKNSIIGFLANKKGNSIELKIREKSESKKLTQIKTGSVCGNEGMKKDKIIYYIRECNSKNICHTKN